MSALFILRTLFFSWIFPAPDPAPATAARYPDLSQWQKQIGADTPDTCWLLVFDAVQAGHCVQGRLQAWLMHSGSGCLASIAVGLPEHSLRYFSERQFGHADALGQMLFDPAASDSLLIAQAFALYPFVSGNLVLPPRIYPLWEEQEEPEGRGEPGWEAGSPDSPSGPVSQEHWKVGTPWYSKVDSVLPENFTVPLGQDWIVREFAPHRWIILDRTFRHLRMLDSEHGNLIWDLDLDWAYDTFYRQFTWPEDHSGLVESILGGGFQPRTFLLPEAFRVSVHDKVIWLSFQRRYPIPFVQQDGTTAIGLAPECFLLHLDSTGSITDQYLLHHSRLPPGYTYSGSGLLPLNPESGWYPMFPSSVSEAKILPLAKYHFSEGHQIELGSQELLTLPDYLAENTTSSSFAELMVGSGAEIAVAAFRYYPKAVLYPSGTPLQFPDTITYRESRLLASVKDFADRRIAWAIQEPFIDAKGLVWMIERRDRKTNRILLFHQDGTCIRHWDIPDWLSKLSLAFAPGGLLAWRTAADGPVIYSIPLPQP